MELSGREKSIFNRYMLLAIFVSLLFFLYNLNGSLPLIMSGIIIMILPIFLSKGENVLLMYVFLSPFVGMIKFQGNPNAIFSYCFFLFNIVYLLRCKYRYAPCILLFHMISVSLTVVMHNDISLLLKIVRFCAFLEFVYCFYPRHKETRYLWYIIKSYIAGVVVNGVYAIVFSVLRGSNIVTSTLSGVRQDRNGFAVLCAFAICFALMDLLYNKSTVNYFIIAFLSIVGILTKSRTFIVVLIFVFSFFLLNLSMTGRKITAIKYIFVFLVLVFLFKDKLHLYLQPVLERFHDEDMATGNGRTTVWALYLAKVFSNPITMLLGCGSTSNYLGIIANQVEHNTFIEMIFNIGIIGSLTLLGVLINLFKTIVLSYKIKRIDICAFLPILTIFMAFSSLSVLYSIDINIPIVLSCIIISLTVRPIEDVLDDTEGHDSFFYGARGELK